jgi:hypothetical protein
MWDGHDVSETEQPSAVYFEEVAAAGAGPMFTFDQVVKWDSGISIWATKIARFGCIWPELSSLARSDFFFIMGTINF